MFLFIFPSVDCTALPPPMENKVYGSAASSSSKSSGSSLHQIIFTVRLEPKVINSGLGRGHAAG